MLPCYPPFQPHFCTAHLKSTQLHGFFDLTALTAAWALMISQTFPFTVYEIWTLLDFLSSFASTNTWNVRLEAKIPSPRLYSTTQSKTMLSLNFKMESGDTHTVLFCGSLQRDTTTLGAWIMRYCGTEMTNFTIGRFDGTNSSSSNGVVGNNSLIRWKSTTTPYAISRERSR